MNIIAGFAALVHDHDKYQEKMAEKRLVALLTRRHIKTRPADKALKLIAALAPLALAALFVALAVAPNEEQRLHRRYEQQAKAARIALENIDELY